MRNRWFCCVATALFLFLPNVVLAEAWEYACSEAITLLRHTQQEVVQKQHQLHQAKLALRVPPAVMEACRSGQGGFDGGQVYCVRHRSNGWNSLGDVTKAADALRKAVEVFEEHLRVMRQTCLAR